MRLSSERSTLRRNALKLNSTVALNSTELTRFGRQGSQVLPGEFGANFFGFELANRREGSYAMAS
jgi:hypothetical protein